MFRKPFLARNRVRAAMPVLGAIAVLAVCAMPRSEVHAQSAGPSIGFHFIGSGEQPRKNSCFHLTASVGQAAPGYSSGQTISIVAGFQVAFPVPSLDEIFFNGFEDC